VKLGVLDELAAEVFALKGRYCCSYSFSVFFFSCGIFPLKLPPSMHCVWREAFFQLSSELSRQERKKERKKVSQVLFGKVRRKEERKKNLKNGCT